MKLRVMDKTFVFLTGLAVLIILALLFVILGNIVANGWTRISWEFLSGNPREGMTAGGIFPAIFGTALLVLLMTIFVVPLGVLVVIVSVEEALRAVPQPFREASYALGATKSQTIFRVVLPDAISGVLTGGILAVSRGAGEVAPILFVGAAYFLPHLPSKLNDQFMELGYHIFVLSTQSPDVEATKPLLYATVLVLLGLTFLLNVVAVVVRARLRVLSGATR